MSAQGDGDHHKIVFSVKTETIRFVRERLLQIKANKARKSHKIVEKKDSKVKKWLPHEVGRLLFCLWEIHVRKIPSPVSGSCNQSALTESASSQISTLSLPFYKSLQDLFNGFE